MSSAPIPARHYPPDGDGHGHPVHLTWAAGTLVVLREDGPPLHIASTALNAEARGFNHEQWALSWPDQAGLHLLMLADRDVAPLRAVAPHLFQAGTRSRRTLQRRWAAGLLALFLLPLLLAGLLLAGLEPLTGRVVAHVPADVERQIGAAVLARVRSEGPLIEDGPAWEAVQAIGQRLARPGETLEFHLAQRPEVNAFAAPGGVVIVHSALLREASDADEVAGVLAHEIAHVELQHSLRQLVRAAGLRVLVTALLGDYGALGGWAAQLGELKFSRDAERDADRQAVTRLAEAGIDPHGLARFLEKLAGREGRDGAVPPALFSTHPATAERLADLRARLAMPGTSPNPAPTKPLAIDWARVRAGLAPSPLEAPPSTPPPVPGPTRANAH